MNTYTVSTDTSLVMSQRSESKELKAPFSRNLCRYRAWEKHPGEKFLIFKKHKVEFRFSSESFPFESRLYAPRWQTFISVSLNHPQQLAEQVLSKYFSTKRLKAKVCMEGSTCSSPQHPLWATLAALPANKYGHFTILFKALRSCQIIFVLL